MVINMTLKEGQSHLTLKTKKVGKYYEAYCPELDVAGYGVQKNEARKELYKTAAAISSFLIATAPDNLEAFDRELQCAKLVERCKDRLPELFGDGRSGI